MSEANSTERKICPICLLAIYGKGIQTSVGLLCSCCFFEKVSEVEVPESD